MNVVQHPNVYEQLIRTARLQITPKLMEGKAQGLPYEVTSIHVVVCEDRKHLMFYADTADEDVTYTTTVEHPVPAGESLDEVAWARAFFAVSLDEEVAV